jgi:hypothetical protein
VVRNIPTIKAGDMMAANGAISCFFIVYLIPIALHFKCLYGDQKTFFRHISDKIGKSQSKQDQ